MRSGRWTARRQSNESEGKLMRTQSQHQPLQVSLSSIKRYVISVLALGILILSVPIIIGQETAPAIPVSVYAVLLGGAVLVARRSGPGGVRRLFSGLLHWRIGWLNWAIVVGAIPVATIGVALVTGTYEAPTDGWLPVVTDYLFTTFIFGALALNLWEETAWNGLVQRNLTRRYGMLRAAVLTAIPFTAFHIPLSFESGNTVSPLEATALTFIGALLMRCVAGRTDRVTGGSLLAVGVFHAAFNASGKLSVVDGDLRYVAAFGIVTILLVTDAVRGRSRAPRVNPSDVVTTAPQEVATS